MRAKYFLYICIICVPIIYGIFQFLVFQPQFSSERLLSNRLKKVLLNDAISEVEEESSWLEIISKRSKNVKEKCKKYSRILKRSEAPILKHTKMPLAYCRGAKAGSTTWNKIFLDMANLVEIKDPHIQALEEFGSTNEIFSKKDKNLLYFTVVRHPYVRLVSAYRDKVKERYKEDKLQWIVKKYRTSTKDIIEWKEISKRIGIFDLEVLPTFREFALNAADEIQECQPMLSNSACLSFLDVHWRPFFDRCAFCDIEYDVISKVETFDRDASYILSKVYHKMEDEEHRNQTRNEGVKHKLKEFLDKSKKVYSETYQNLKLGHVVPQEHKSVGLKSSEVTKIMINLLSDTERKKIYKAYFLDFQMFGYDPQIFD